MIFTGHCSIIPFLNIYNWLKGITYAVKIECKFFPFFISIFGESENYTLFHCALFNDSAMILVTCIILCIPDVRIMCTVYAHEHILTI